MKRAFSVHSEYERSGNPYMICCSIREQFSVQFAYEIVSAIWETLCGPQHSGVPSNFRNEIAECGTEQENGAVA
jgi:hypothetical protein